MKDYVLERTENMRERDKILEALLYKVANSPPAFRTADIAGRRSVAFYLFFSKILI